jgi:hypothetical protein
MFGGGVVVSVGVMETTGAGATSAGAAAGAVTAVAAGADGVSAFARRGTNKTKAKRTTDNLRILISFSEVLKTFQIGTIICLSGHIPFTNVL